MKKIFKYLIIFIFIIFIIPSICTKKRQGFSIGNEKSNQEINNIEQKDVQEVEYNYNKYSTIKLLHSTTGIIDEITMDEYLFRSG